MADYIRARTPDQKLERLEEIKSATHALFLQSSYHAINLSAIASKLGWTRAMLYKYVSTKEEIFLALSADQRRSYFQALRAAYPLGADYDLKTLSKVWSQVLCCHKGYLCYSDILYSIIETNVSVDTLAAFKADYYEDASSLESVFATNLNLPEDTVTKLFSSVHYHATGIKCCSCCNPLLKQALDKAHIKVQNMDFASNMEDFILMNLSWHCSRNEA